MIESDLLSNCLGYIDGKWVPARSGRTLRVISPATGECLAEVPNMDGAEAVEAIESGARAMGLGKYCEIQTVVKA